MDLISLKKPLKEDQVNGMHSLNQENIPEVGDVSDLVDFQLLLDFSEHILCFKDKGVVIGFVLCMREGQSYQSENYKYLTSRFSNFLYIDRIAIKKEYRRRGLGEKIYLELVSIAEKLGLDIYINFEFDILRCAYSLRTVFQMERTNLERAISNFTF